MRVHGAGVGWGMWGGGRPSEFRSQCRDQAKPACAAAGALAWNMAFYLEVVPVPKPWVSLSRQRRVEWAEEQCQKLSGMWLQQLPSAAIERIQSDSWDGQGALVDVRESATRSRSDIERNAVWIFPCLRCPALKIHMHRNLHAGLFLLSLSRWAPPCPLPPTV